MKILTRKKQDEIIKRICANEIIFRSQNKDIECIDKYMENSTEIAELVGGYGCALKYLFTVQEWLENKMRNLDGEQE